MKFYQISVDTCDLDAASQSASSMDRRSHDRELAEKIRDETELFNRGKSDVLFYTARQSSRQLIIGAIARKNITRKSTEGYLSALGIAYDQLHAEECTIQNTLDNLGLASRNRYIASYDHFLTAAGLKNLICSNLGFITEKLLPGKKNMDTLLKTLDYLPSDSLKEEIRRIYEIPSGKAFISHPVHYIVETDDDDTRAVMIESILTALYSAGRIRNRRYTRVDTSDRSFDSDEYQDILESSRQGAMLLECFNVGFSSGPILVRDSSMQDLSRVMKQSRRHMDAVLMIICLPKSCNKIKSSLFSMIDNRTFIEIKENPADGDSADGYLSHLASLHHMCPNERLYGPTRNSTEKYSISELTDIFSDWMQGELKTRIFPQYANLQSSKDIVRSLEVEGSAYDKLQKMIGLSNAKQAMDKVLNYYKAQKLFKDKGMASTYPSLHMIFTGNPGTAKTTVARLYAQILKENGILSEGRLYEVGRSDLVGRYVGWTAGIVKEKFKKAQGSVLFIDEAYSLLDGKDRSFGDEAINTIVQEMENHREDVVVIFAGYPREMQEFLQRNPGLNSRVPFHIHFDDYSAPELYAIAEKIAADDNMILAEDVKEKIMPFLMQACSSPGFGNGRFVRNMVEGAKLNLANRLIDIPYDRVTKSDLLTLRAEDFEAPQPEAAPARKQIGFIVA